MIGGVAAQLLIELFLEFIQVTALLIVNRRVFQVLEQTARYHAGQQRFGGVSALIAHHPRRDQEATNETLTTRRGKHCAMEVFQYQTF